MPQLPMAGPASFGRRASGGDFGGAEADAAAQRGGALAGIGQAATQTVVRFDQVQEAANDAKLARKAAEVSAGYDKAVFDLSADPDIDTHEERFEKSRAQLLKDAQAALPPELHGRLEDRVFGAGSHARIEVAGNVRTKRIGAARADTDEMLRLSADQAAQTPDPIRRGQIRGQAVGALDAQLRGGILDQAAHDKAVRGFDRDVSLADLRRMTREDPSAVFKRLGNAADPLAAGFDAAEREQFRTQAKTEVEGQLRESREDVRFQQVQQDRAEKEAGERAVKNLDDLWAKRDVAGVQDELRRTREVLSPEQYGHFVDLLSGKAPAPKTVPAVYGDFSKRAALGEPVAEEADAAYRAGTIDQDDLQRILKASEDRRFGTVQTFLHSAMTQGQYDFDPSRQLKSAEVQRQFGEWKATHPDATANDALEYGRGLMRAVGVKDGSALLRPADPRGPDGKVDVNPLIQQAMDRAARGELDEVGLGAELKRLKDLEEAQQRAGSVK